MHFEKAGAAILYILQLTSVCLYSSRGPYAKKHDNTVASLFKVFVTFCAAGTQI